VTGRSIGVATATPGAPPAAEAGLLPWSLAAPLSREVVLADSRPDDLLVLGGLSGGSSDQGAYRVSAASGAASLLGNLSEATHDAAGADLGGSAFVFGGGAASAIASSQQLRPSGASSMPGQLPAARADASAVTIGSTAYVVGGYDGSTMDAPVLATSDGRSFRALVNLPVPVRYAAVAALGGRIYVLGGENAQGQVVPTVQIVDPVRRTVALGHPLPVALAGAATGVLDGTIYIAGGLRGPGAGSPTSTIYAFDPAAGRFLRAGTLPVAVSNAGAAVLSGRLYIVGGETAGGTPSAAVQMVRPNRAFGAAGLTGAGSPFFGDELLIADRGNNRLLLVDDTGKVIWSYPSASKPAPPGGFYFPDDAFFIRHGSAIISNQEENDTVVEIAYPSGRILWQYGHPRIAGSAPGYLNNPDDAYLLRDGDISVADPMNCRVLVIDPKTKEVLTQIGTPGTCAHNPPTDLGSPNGDTPLADGNLLVSEINGNWIDEYTTSGKLVWDCQLPSVGYVSDPQQIGSDRYLVADYESPGAFVEFNRNCDVLYRYGPSSGPGALNHPSLVEQLPSGVLMANDDYNDRIVAVDPATGALVYQYGTTGVAGTSRGLLNTPDGFDILAPGGVTPTHAATG
jgi:outer membrane protein assembly factor BamB